MGRFDDLRKGELVKRIHGKRQRLKSNTHIDAEKVTIKSVIRQVESRESQKQIGVTNSINAYEGVIPDAPEGLSKRTKGRVKR